MKILDVIEENNAPLISIAMATYNGEKYLKEQLDSIYSQTHKNIEVIVTDDCSTDKTVEVLEQYSKSHGLKYFVNEQNLGFVKNFEKAASLCQGEYIALSDQDDIWLPHKLTSLVQNIGDNILACSDAKLIDENNIVIAESQFEYSKRPKNIKLTFYKLMFRNYIWGCTILMKKEILKKAHPIPLGAESHDQWYGLIASSLGGIYIHKEPLMLYRQHVENHFGAKRHTRVSIINKILLMINPEHFKKRVMEGKEKSERLKVYRDSNKFSNFENSILEDLILYYKSRGEGFIHIKSFFIALKYKDDLQYNIPKHLRFFACFRSLFL